MTQEGEGFPDIALLPKIAAFYDVTVDTLLGCDELAKDEAINDFKIRCHEINHAGDMKGWLALCRTMQKEYPNDESVLLELMYALMENGITEHAKEIIEIGQKLILSTDYECHNSAIQALSHTYAAIGERETAVRYAKMTPVYEDLLVAVLEGKERAEHCRWNIWRLCDNLGMQIAYLLSCTEAGYTAAEKHKIREILNNAYHLIFHDGDFGFWEDRLARNYFEMAVLSAECGENDRALSELEDMLEHIEKSEKFTSIDHTSLSVRGIHYESSMAVKNYEGSMCCEYMDKMKHSCFDGIRSDIRFGSVVDKIKEIANYAK